MKLFDVTWFARMGLGARVHLEALWQSPTAYLTAAKWWILRKRVRAHGQLAPLLGKSSRAYEWSRLRQSAEFCEPSPRGVPPIVALINCTANESDLQKTQASLALECIEAYVIKNGRIADFQIAVANIDWSESPWLLPIHAGDLFAPRAAQTYRKSIESGTPHKLIYADDDIVDLRGHLTAPHFKPDWNAELYSCHDYLAGACIVRANKSDLEAAAVQSDWAASLVDQALAEGGGATHVRQVLHHRRRRQTPRFPLPAVPIAKNLPRTSVVVPTRNRVDLLSTCIAGLNAVEYPDLEVIIVDNDSDDPATLAYLADLAKKGVRVIRHEGAFNYSAINNRAVAEATGELICLLNNDIEMIAPDWLAIMATQALRDEVGAVGAQLLYPDGRIQHAGVVIGVGNAAGHAHRFLRPADEGYFRRHALPQFASAVTAACLVVRRDRYLAVGGLNEEQFKVAYNDVDLCLRLNARGWQSLYEPRAVLVHHESVSRGWDRDPIGAARFASELAALQQAWETDRIVDPFHHPQLSRASEQFALAI